MGGGIWSVVSLSISIYIALIIVSILDSYAIEEEGNMGSHSFPLSASSLLLSLVMVRLIYTSMEYFIISTKEADFLSLSHRVKSLSKSLAYCS